MLVKARRGAILLCCAVAAYFALLLCKPEWMPRCLVRAVTGYDCPMCGSQRALYALLHGDIVAATGHNPFLLFIVPTVAVVVYVSLSRDRFARWLQPCVYSRPAIALFALATAAWWIFRNL